MENDFLEIWVNEMKSRKCDLIDKALTSRLSTSEEVELAGLQCDLEAYQNQKLLFPLERFKRMGKLLQESKEIRYKR